MDLRIYLQTALDAAYLAKGIHQYYQEKGFTLSSKSTPRTWSPRPTTSRKRPSEN
jgi:hypothetical protein